MTGSAAPYEAIIFDLDGTLFRGRTAISGAVNALNRLRRFVPCRFLSNNGERRSATLAERLRNFGFNAEEDEVISSADLVLGYLEDRGETCRILALTSDDLATALADRGHRIVSDDTAEIVVVGVDRHLTRERMVQGLRAVLNGALLIGTNEDPTYPGNDGLRPAAGAYVGFFRGMGFEPIHLCGKPDEWAVRTSLAEWGIGDPSRCLFVGDNLRTDIAAAHAVGSDSVLVLTGVSARSDVETSRARPSAIVESVGELDPERIDAIANRRHVPDSPVVNESGGPA